MYISMPKDFYVPVIFSDEFKVNEVTGQVEYDSERSKKNYSNNSVKAEPIKTNKKVDIDSYKKENFKLLKEVEDIYELVDSEYIEEALNN